MLERKDPQPRKPEELLLFRVIKANEANYDEAAQLLQKALQANPRDEKVHYVLASTLAAKGDRREALDHLREAIELNATNRIHARNDPDFEPLRDDENFQNLIHPRRSRSPAATAGDEHESEEGRPEGRMDPGDRSDRGRPEPCARRGL